jgi:predicted metalloprotease
MRWDDFRRSDNIEDRRDDGPGGFGGSGIGIPVGGRGGLGIGTIIVLGLVGWALGIDPRLLIGGAEMMSGSRQQYEEQAPSRSRPTGQPQDQGGQFAAAILGNTEDVWKVQLPQQMQTDYKNPRLVLFSGATRSGCGAAQSAMGPFYCPLDQRVYIDLAFFNEMRRRFRVDGDFAYAYVIAHEVGHHVQNLLGVLPKVERAKQRASEAQANQLSVRVELMADCLAGVWAYHSNQQYKSLEQGDIEKAIAAAEAIGDDRLQKQAQGYAVPDSFTHGSSAQRVRWLQTGLKSGQVSSCDTFRAGRL